VSKLHYCREHKCWAPTGRRMFDCPELRITLTENVAQPLEPFVVVRLDLPDGSHAMAQVTLRDIAGAVNSMAELANARRAALSGFAFRAPPGGTGSTPPAGGKWSAN
jgi:hypothetical protein